MVEVNNISAKSTLKLVRISGTVLKALIDSIKLINRERRAKTVIHWNNLVSNRHDLAKHIIWLISQTNVVAIRLTHLLSTISAYKKRHSKRNLRLHVHITHKITTGKQVEDLVVSAHLYVCLDNNRIICLKNWINKLMEGNWLLVVITIREVFSLKNTSNGELAHKTKHGLKVHRLNPVTVMNNGSSFWIKNLHCLVDVGLCVGIYLLCSERRTGRVTSRRVANQCGATTNN